MAGRATLSSATTALVSVDFEIFGKVQGVFFRKEFLQKAAEQIRKHTRSTAGHYGLVGWVRNTSRKTVEGQVQGPGDKIKPMKTWLNTKGSPKSNITKADFRNERSIEKLDYTEFGIIR